MNEEMRQYFLSFEEAKEIMRQMRDNGQPINTMEEYKNWIHSYYDSSHITIKQVGSPEFPRYVLVQGGKYYSEIFYCDGSHGNGWEEAFEDALWFASWKNASWRRFNLI